MKVPPDKGKSKPPAGPLAGTYIFHTRCESTHAYERADGAFLVFVDTGRPELPNKTRWYIKDGEGNYIGSMWRGIVTGPEFDDRKFRYRIRWTEPGTIKVETLRVKGTKRGRGRGRGTADV